jgi:hypothetical protein
MTKSPILKLTPGDEVERSWNMANSFSSPNVQLTVQRRSCAEERTRPGGDEQIKGKKYMGDQIRGPTNWKKGKQEKKKDT